MKSILVTGGGGFIGSNLVAALIDRNTHNIVVCDTFGVGDKWRNLSKHAVYEIVAPEDLFGWLSEHHSEVEMIYHLGSISSTVADHIDDVLKNNFALSLKLLRFCNSKNIRIVYASAAATYGAGEQGFDDSMDLTYLKSLKPLSGYGWSKHLFDLHMATLASRSQLQLPQWVGIKFFNSYGPNEYHKGEQQSVISKIASHALQAGNVKLFRSYNKSFPDGGQKRDVVYVKDISKVLMWLLDNPKVSGLFNLGTGSAVTFNDMANSIFAALNRPAKIQYMDMPSELVNKYQYHTEAKIDRLRAAGYTVPFTSVQDGIKDYVQNYLLKPDQYL